MTTNNYPKDLVHWVRLTPIYWTILANLKIGATYLSKLRIMERIYFVYSSMLKSHQIGEQCVLSILSINQSEFGKTFPECSKAAIRVQRASQSRIYPLQWEMNESQPWSTIRAGASAAATTSLCQCYQTCWWAPGLGPTSSWVMSSSTPIMWTDIYMTPGVIYCHYFLHPEAHMQ